MAFHLKKSLKHLLRDSQCIRATVSLGPVRSVTYSSDYLDPTISKEELEQPLRESDPRKFSKIKAAKTDESTFADYDPVLNKLVNTLMERGDKKTARKILARTLENIKHIQVEKYHKADVDTKPTIELDPIRVVLQAIENGKPLLTTEKVRKGGTTYQVPIPCRPNVQLRKSMKWLKESAQKKDDDIRIYDSLAREIIDTYNNRGKTIQRKIELHKLCEANKAYAHFRWT